MTDAAGRRRGASRGTVRVAAGQGFWGDDLEAPVRQVNGGDIDYLMLDYLAEVTMSIMRKQRSRDPNAGYARDFVPLMERIFPACAERGIGVVTNAGGVNPVECAGAVAEAGRRAGVGGARADRRGDRRRPHGPARRTSRFGSSPAQHGDRAAPGRGPRPGAERERLSGGAAHRRRARRGGHRRGHGPFHRHRAHLRSHGECVRLVLGRLGHAGERGGRGAHQRVRSAGQRRELLGRVVVHSRSCRRRLPHHRGELRREFRRHQAPGVGRCREPAHRQGADPVRDGRSLVLHNARRGRRLHDHPAVGRRRGPGPGARHPGDARPRRR